MRLLSLLIVALVAPSGIGETRIVHVGDFYFQDQASMNAHTRINVGDSVKWQWISGNHTTTEVNELWNAAINSVTQSYERSFNEPGLWEYYCTMDPLVMRGTVRALGTQTPRSAHRLRCQPRSNRLGRIQLDPSERQRPCHHPPWTRFFLANPSDHDSRVDSDSTWEGRQFTHFTGRRPRLKH